MNENRELSNRLLKLEVSLKEYIENNNNFALYISIYIYICIYKYIYANK